MYDNNPSEESYDFDIVEEPRGTYVEMVRENIEDAFHYCSICMDDSYLINLTIPKEVVKWN